MLGSGLAIKQIPSQHSAMASPLRIEFPGGLYHVTSLGDGRQDIFLCDQDRLAWLETLAQVWERFNWVCHAYCQMTDHYHAVVETLGKRGVIHVESWRLAWDGQKGGFCSKYREYLQENQRSRPFIPGDHEPR